jgi:dihydroneopterin triphosphate diphosphatase
MPRAPLQVLVLPFRVGDSGRIEYAVFKRAGGRGACWQGIAGWSRGGETAEQASVPAYLFRDRRPWGPDTYVIPQRAFGVRLSGHEIALSEEHTEYRWAAYEAAADLLRWDSNRTALWELNERLQGSRG